jgi:hypothetical protein
MVFYFVWYAILKKIKKSTSATIRGAKADLIILVLFFFILFFYLVVEKIPRIIRDARTIKVSNIFSYPNTSQSQAPIAEIIPIISVANIRAGVTKLIPITSNCNSSNKAGIENTAMNTNGACRLNRNIISPHT